MPNETTSRHDDSTPRLTPYELVFAHEYFETDRFPAILDEVDAVGADTADPDQFLALSRSTNLLRELAPDEAGADLYGRYGALLYQAWHFWRFERKLLVLDTPVARHLVESFPEAGAWELTPPHAAGYLQLPRHLFWARVDESASPEPVDGFFWTMLGRDDVKVPPFERLEVLLVLGMRPGRPGFGTVPVSAELHGAPLGHWADAEARPEGEDFSNILPGGELQDWYALVTELEVLKLVSRIFRYLALNPKALGAVERVASGAASAQPALPPSALPFQRIREVTGG